MFNSKTKKSTRIARNEVSFITQIILLGLFGLLIFCSYCYSQADSNTNPSHTKVLIISDQQQQLQD